MLKPNLNSLDRLTLMAILLSPCIAHAAGGTAIVATKGQKAFAHPKWSTGIETIVNDKSRTNGWNPWFTEWPNDVNHYAMEIESTADVNRLIDRLSKVKAKPLQIRLCNDKAPGAIGWVSRAPEGNTIPIIFSFGNQSQIDEWCQRVRKPFGRMQFLDTPVAVPPTLTLFVQNPKIELDKLKIPKNIKVEAGLIPTLFHRSNTKREREIEKKKSEPTQKQSVNDGKTKTPIKPRSKAEISAQEAIDKLLKNRKPKKSTARTDKQKPKSAQAK